MLVYLLILLVNCAISGCVARILAGSKGYEGYFWTGFLLGVVGVVYVAGLPLSEEMREKEFREMVEKLRAEGVLSGEGPTPPNRAPEPARSDDFRPAETTASRAAGSFVVPRDFDGLFHCPACGKVQRSNRSVCFQCGAKFVRNTEERGDARGEQSE